MTVSRAAELLELARRQLFRMSTREHYTDLRPTFGSENRIVRDGTAKTHVARKLAISPPDR
jgi:hypothetical protein